MGRFDFHPIKIKKEDIEEAIAEQGGRMSGLRVVLGRSAYEWSERHNCYLCYGTFTTRDNNNREKWLNGEDVELLT